MEDKKMDYYRKLRLKIVDWIDSEAGQKHKYADYILLVPDFFYLLVKLTMDKEVSLDDKAKLALALAYFISPIDLLPEAFLGPIGYLDDLAISAYVLNGIINNNSPEVIQKHWVGDGDILQLIKNVLAKADEMIGSGLWGKIKKVVK